MIERILKGFAFVRGLQEETQRLKWALESAGRYATVLESLKEHQAIRIKDLEAEVAELKGHLNGRRLP
jgi:hypothetical protein